LTTSERFNLHHGKKIPQKKKEQSPMLANISVNFTKLIYRHFSQKLALDEKG
jgi:hypothetical protein